MNLAVSPGSPATALTRRIRVMIVDDAIVVRGLFTRWVEAEPDLEIVASLRTGREAVAQIERADPDVVVLDIDMPELDGIAALPLLLEKKRDLVVIMASTLTRRNAEISLKALSLGATDYIPKPSSTEEFNGAATFRRELIEKIRQLGLRSKRLRTALTRGTGAAEPKIDIRADTKSTPQSAAAPRVAHELAHAPIRLRPMPLMPPRALLIGCSTGGPQALNLIVAQLSGVVERVPVLITQHMPATFTAILAEHLGRIAKCPVREAIDGEEINAGTIYLAPGGKHMSVARRDGTPVVAIDDGPPVNFCKPAVDPLFTTGAAVWGPKALAVVLTGMGADGLRGAQAIVAAGGAVIAQDEPTSVVWGMPGQVATAGLCSAVLPVTEIAPRLTRLFAGDRT